MSTLVSSTMNKIPVKKKCISDFEDIDDRSFLDSFDLNQDMPVSYSVGCGSSPNVLQSQKYLRELSSLSNFSFNINFDDNATSSRQHVVDKQNNTSSMNKLFSMFGNNPIFNNCSFNIN